MELSINFEDVVLSKFTSNQNDPQVTCGLFLVNSGVIWEKMEGSNINLTGKSKAKVEQCRDCFKKISIIILLLHSDIRSPGRADPDHQPRLGLLQDGHRGTGHRVQRHLPKSLRLQGFPSRDHGPARLQAREGHLALRTPWHW